MQTQPALTSRIRIMVVDDHPLVRMGLRALIHTEKDFQVVGEAANGQELVRLLPQVPADIILMDIQMPQLDGLAATRYVQVHYPAIKVLMLSGYEQVSYVTESLAAGAAGYLTKKAGSEELILAIRRVVAGKPFLDSHISFDLLQELWRPTKKSEALVSVPTPLTDDERRVLQLLAAGFTNNEIAQKLFYSKSTIAAHRQRLIRKTNSSNTAALIKYALVHHLLP